MSLFDDIHFMLHAFRSAWQTGAFSPTSKVVADRLANTLPWGGVTPVRILEVGAGNGAISRSLVERLGPDDRLDLNEINPAFAARLRTRFDDPRVTVLEGDVTELDAVEPYHAVVASLPLLHMPVDVLERVFTVMLDELLVPGGTLAYYDYWGKGVRARLPTPERRRIRDNLATTERFLDRHQIRSEVVLRNFPPAHVHVLQTVAAPVEARR